MAITLRDITWRIYIKGGYWNVYLYEEMELLSTRPSLNFQLLVVNWQLYTNNHIEYGKTTAINTVINEWYTVRYAAVYSVVWLLGIV